MQRTRSGTAASTPSSPHHQQSLPVVDSVLDYEKLHRIGEGTYGVVYKARHIHTGQVVALKKVRFDRSREGVPVTSMRELAVLQQSHHPNIVQLLKVVTGTRSDSVFLVFEYCDHDLGRILDTHQPSAFSEAETKCLFRQLLSAVSYLHSRWVLHRDLKLSNLLYTGSTGQLKLCDFGLASIFTPPYTYGPAIDCWSLGCILGELLKGEPLFPASTEAECLQMHCQLLGTPVPRIWPAMRTLPLAGNMRWPEQAYNLLRRQFPELSDAGLTLLNGLLTYDPDQRFTAHQALNSQYFRERPYPRRTTDMPAFPSISNPGSSRAPAGPVSRKAHGPLHMSGSAETGAAAAVRGSSSRQLQHQSVLGRRARHNMAAGGVEQSQWDAQHRRLVRGEPGTAVSGLPPLLFQRYQLGGEEDDRGLGLELDSGKRQRTQL
eukprot:gene10109-10265_t